MAYGEITVDILEIFAEKAARTLTPRDIKAGKLTLHLGIAEWQKSYRDANKTRIAARKKAYYERNREKIAARKRLYWERNRDKLRAQMKEYRKRKKALTLSSENV